MSEIPKIDALLAELRQVAEGQGGEQARLQEMMARVDAFERELLNSYEDDATSTASGWRWPEFVTEWRAWGNWSATRAGAWCSSGWSTNCGAGPDCVNELVNVSTCVRDRPKTCQRAIAG